MSRGAGVIALAAAVVMAAGCNKPSPTMDDALRQDLQLATPGARGAVTISAVEEGEMSAPTHAAARRTPSPVSHAAPRMAAHRAERVRAPAPAPAPRAVAQAPTAPTVSRTPTPRTAPAVTPAPAPQRQRGTYSTEGEIFQRMPWIRP